jgi:hypothetical protein
MGLSGIGMPKNLNFIRLIYKTAPFRYFKTKTGRIISTNSSHFIKIGTFSECPYG